ncbi:GDSL esterase/lipase At5g45670-like [Chenopodium quinoa]|uniref:GDSL esterase/lipase At5g45670-like n=1 Tax=Chenopodium quinoa TaxID=63459 RepID=UPI000B76C2EE|nr:GDSL esterase/lipase At5g45670-like [Chenopodium quinoa]
MRRYISDATRCYIHRLPVLHFSSIPLRALEKAKKYVRTIAKSSVLCIILSIFLLVVRCSLACDNITGLKGIFAFGDDVVDNGNNNNIPTIHLKSNYMPYGVDFPYGPTGRFSNGKTIVDCVADNLKLHSPPPYPDFFHKGTPLLDGINFGSSGTGIFAITGGLLIGVQHMDQQINRFKNDILPKLKDMLGCSGQIILPQYLFVIGAGNNDYSSYYILKQYLFITPEVFAANLVKQYVEYITDLYKLGARKFLLISTYPLGCGPGIVQESKECVKFLNDASEMFYDQLQIALKHQQQNFLDAEFSVLNSFQLLSEVITNNATAAATGFKNCNCACCDTNLGDTCKKAGKTCLNRNEYLYYDGIHLTEAANCYLASKAFDSANTAEVSPVNVKALISGKNRN